jgi:hypothetical protein
MLLNARYSIIHIFTKIIHNTAVFSCICDGAVEISEIWSQIPFTTVLVHSRTCSLKVANLCQTRGESTVAE